MAKANRGKTKPSKKRDLNRGGVKLKSTLETYCYDQLREAKLKFNYEGETFHLMDSFRFIIETKGFVPSQHTFPLRWKLFLKYMVENDMDDYMLFIPKNKKQIEHAVSIIKNKVNDRS